jgi:phosphate transport system substrate-binding protein
LSEKRAEKVAEELRAYGLNATEITGFCDDMPVGSNETEEGRARNRRVEVWLR